MTANGHALAPFTVPHVPRGPVSALPPRDDPGRLRHAMSVVAARRAWLAAVPVILVNAVAFCGQLAFLRVHLPWPLGGQVLVAVTLESVAVYLAWQAHLALTAGDSALRLRLAAYGFAAVIGVMNYSHYMGPGWRPTFAAVTFGLMSVSSPWLWSVHSRRVSRDALMAVGDLESHAVRLGMTRWVWHPRRSARVMFLATWEGVTKPADAIALLAAADGMSGDGPGAAGQPGKNGGEGAGLVGPPLGSVAAVAAPVVTPVRGKPPEPPGGDRQPSAMDRARAVLRDHPGMTNKQAAERAGVDVRTIQRARNSNPGSAT